MHRVELRVHGVAGASPQSVLYPGHPGTANPGKVEPDGVTGGVGFYRPDPQPDDWNRQAYVWGSLTSGRASRALWLLLLPFALANIAFFMTPRRMVNGVERSGGVRLAVDAGQRLFALSLTGTALLGFAGVAVDILGWQSGHAATTWLGRLGPAEAPLRLALASLLPALVLALMWLLSNRSWQATDRVPVPEGAEPEPGGPLLARRRMWNGGPPVGRLRSLHVAFGFTLIAAVLTLAFPSPALLAAEATVGAVVVISVALPYAATRRDPGAAPTALTLLCTGLRWAGLALYVAALILLFRTDGQAPAAGPLPGFGPLVVTLLWTQIGLIALIALGVALLARGGRPPGLYDRALLGLAAPATLLIAWTYTAAFSIGASFAAAELVGTPVFAPVSTPADAVVLPDSYAWALYAVPIGIGTVLLLGIWLLVTWLRTAAAPNALIDGRYPPGERARVARAWAAATLTDKAQVVLAALALTALGTLALVGVVLATGPETRPWPPLVAAGAIILGGFVVVLLVVGWLAYRVPVLRRTVGVLWDLSTFWPRAIHPLAPPCYSERVVPELITRMNRLIGEGNRVVLSGHSQGSVIAAAVVLQLDPADRPSARLLTHGSPLARLYARFFPAYFDLGMLHAVREAMGWQNLYRDSDPIGGPVFAFAAIEPADPAATDQSLWDPEDAVAGARVLGHVDYYLDQRYSDALEALSGP
ncbi:hypothetical protein [Acrocarpospora catenulata]|uniref:hypothetical protein n=1 Tax=Acrocarpospora catenulata TaxID=2836182 RepID=UPI001BDAA355|nr:hypothetical protein [Acrocarpospora catenulata]